MTQFKWHYAMIIGAILTVTGILLFWRSLEVPFGLLFWTSLAGTLLGTALIFGSIGLRLWRLEHHFVKTLGIASIILSFLPALAITFGFIFQDTLYLLILSTEAADSPWEVTEMSLNVTVLPEAEQLTVSGETYLTLSECCSRSVVLSLPPESMVFDNITSDDHASVIYRNGTLTRVMLSEIYQAGEVVHVSFTYHNRVNRIDNFIVPFTDFAVEGNFAYVVEPYPWYPMPFGARDPVAAKISITVPEGWKTLSNGRFVDSQQLSDGRTQENWLVQSPTRLSFVAAPYDVVRKQVNGRDYAVYTLNRPREVGENSISILTTIVEILESHYGPYPTAGYALLEVPSEYIHHNAESQIGYLISDPSLLFPGGQPGIPLIAHEFSHGWWGDFVENIDPGRRMVNEALAQYSAALVIEELNGRKAMVDFLRFNDPGYAPHQSAQWYFTQILGTDQDVPLIDASHFLANTKGHWFYHMLRNRVGNEQFFDSLREILEKHGGKTASMHDIQAVFEKNSPIEKNVDVFFEQWLQRPGVPRLEYTWEVNEANGHLEVTIQQRAEIYDLFVETGYQDEQGEHIKRVHLMHAEQRFSMPIEGEVIFVDIDPNHESLILFPEREQEYRN